MTVATSCKTEKKDNCEYGSLTDDRDGQTYKTVKIGEQIWMAENLNYEELNSYCYNDSAEYCAKYGRLYTWAAAMDSAGEWSNNGRACGLNMMTCSPKYPVRGICPEGWLTNLLSQHAGYRRETGFAKTQKRPRVNRGLFCTILVNKNFLDKNIFSAFL